MKITNSLLRYSMLSTKHSYIFSKSKPSIRDVLQTYSQQLASSQIMESMIPRKFTEESLLQLCHNQRFTEGKNPLLSLNASLGEPVWELLDRGGKRWRPVLAMLVAELLGKPREIVLQVAALIQVIHNGTLLVDDIQDSSTVRRDKPCIHLMYGDDIAINAGNFMYFAPMLRLFSMFQGRVREKLTAIYLQEMTQLHLGQAMDIIWHKKGPRHIEKITEEYYMQMTAHKTAVLARIGARMACAVCEASRQDEIFLSRFVDSLGVAFQIQDDLLNLQGEEFKKTKGYSGQDIHQGKITLMVIHCLKHANPKEAEILIDILSQHTNSPSLIQRAIQIMRESGSLQYCRNRMQSLITDCNSELDIHFGGRAPQQSLSLLRELAAFGIHRTT